MILFNISLEKIQIFWEKKYNLENKNIERELPKKLKTITQESEDKNILVINGPWSFTALRSWCLALNILNFSCDFFYDIYSISKIDLYKYLFNNWFLPKIGIIFIWQKNNFWKYNFETKTQEKINYKNISFDENTFIDTLWYIKEEDIKNKALPKLINFNIKNSAFFMDFDQKNIKIDPEELNLEPTKEISPNYMINPNIQKN